MAGSKSKNEVEIHLPEQISLGQEFKVIMDLTREQIKARDEIMSILGPRPNNRQRAHQWSEMYNTMCADEGVPTRTNGLPFSLRFVPRNEQRPTEGDDRQIKSGVTCAQVGCSVNSGPITVGLAKGWRCEEHGGTARSENERVREIQIPKVARTLKATFLSPEERQVAQSTLDSANLIDGDGEDEEPF